MKVLLIYAHPEPRSLNGALKNFAVRHLQQAGHEVQVSDLYAMRWKAGYDADDSGAPPVGEFWRRPSIPNRPLPRAPKARISPPSRKSCCGPIR
jgi:putative NADPH-quinone reductase